MNENASVPMVQLLSPEGDFSVPKQYAEYGKYIERLNEEDFLKFYRDMARCRRFDNEATALQRQGQLGLWAPAIGQEAAQIGSGYGVGKNDHIFPSYREHGVAITHGIELVSILKMFRGVNHGGWNPEETRFHLYAHSCFSVKTISGLFRHLPTAKLACLFTSAEPASAFPVLELMATMCWPVTR